MEPTGSPEDGSPPGAVPEAPAHPGPAAVGTDRAGQAVRVRVIATERTGNGQTRVSYEIRLPGGRAPHSGALLLPSPSTMSELDMELRGALIDVLADEGLPRQLVTTVVYD